MRATILACALAGMCAWCAFAVEVNVIYQHNPYYNDPNNPGYPFYEIFDPPENRVRIYHGADGQTFEFEATLEDNGQYQGPGDITRIVADPDAGFVRITIVGHSGRPYGARNVGEINLKATGVNGWVGEVKLQGDLAELGPLQAHGLVEALTVDPNDPTGGDILNDIEVDSFGAALVCKSMRGLRALGGTREDGWHPSITVRGPWGTHGEVIDTIQVSPLVETISIGSDSGGDMSGVIIVGDPNEPGDPNKPILTSLETWGISATGFVQVYGTLASMNVGSALEGAVEMTNLIPGPDQYSLIYDLPGRVVVRETMRGYTTVTNSLPGEFRVGDFNSWVFLYGNLSGTFAVTHMNGVLFSYADISGRVLVENDLSGVIKTEMWDPNYPVAPPDLTGSIEVGGDFVAGWIFIRGALGDPNSPTWPPRGFVCVRGSYRGLEGQTPPSMWFYGGKAGPSSFVCVNYDGAGEDVWDPNAVIVTGADPDDPNNVHTGNTLALHLWEVKCKGDMDGDQTVGFPDINPFILALSNPLGYSQDYPGLGCTNDPNDPDCLSGSRVWHGDLNCDGVLDFLDINPFVALMTNPCCQATCDPCPPPPGDGENSIQRESLYGGDSGLPALSPQELAAQLAANTWPELYNDLLAMVEAAIDAAPDEATQAYWLAVYEAFP